VRRVWPGRLEVTVEEHVALARWGDDRLVNTFGETFSAKTTHALPAFVAPGGTAAEVVRRYHRFNELVAPLGTGVERVVLTQRLAWQLRLGNGLHLMLGRDADLAEERLKKFVEAHSATLARMGKKHEYVDLRYPNGFAVRVPDWNG
jgi:cell division protein FtsQ